ncbi:carboxypeptidase regulatory-like domain-containing protein [Pedosphaera parvula]|uniref:Carboxypeptidase regulatory-like domain-containing protein n=1 Tax=Pedosphaera parvula (strain Ellin514) TaxID=320771 RepID=B9XDE8_PEDPL|nr:carboxypeptidase regulatory-like domain-containing protein [Pedosphaera parvula]EEF62094.1 hypothetical protein Cflav_PD6369 [Pedosphaera parvula Ellin514]
MNKPTFLPILAAVFLSSIFHPQSSSLGATITGTIVNTAGLPLATNITFTPLSTPQVNGTNLVSSTINTITSSPNGGFTNILNAGDYKVTIGAAARDSFVITVPTNSGTFQMSTLITSALAYNSSAAPAYEFKLNKGQTNGYPALDGSAHVPTTQLGSGTAGTNTFLRGDGAWVTGVARLPDATNIFNALNPWQPNANSGGIIATNPVTIQAANDGTWPSLEFSLYDYSVPYQFASASLHMDDLGETVLASSVPYWAQQGIYLGGGSNPKLTADNIGGLLLDGNPLRANDPAALQAANNLSDVASKSAAAQKVGVYPLIQSGSSWGGFAAATPSYVRQLGLMDNGGGVPYLVWSKSTSQGDWQGGFAFYGQCQFGDPTHMNPTRDVAEFKFIVNGTGATQDPATLSSPADNVMRWKNQCRTHFSATAWDSCDADGLGERGAMGYGNSACPIYVKLNYLESYGTLSSFLFAGSGYIYSGMEKLSGDFVRYSSNTTTDDVSRVTYRVKSTGETRQNGDSYVQGIIRAGTGVLSGGGYPITTTDGHLNTQYLDPTQTATINRTLFNTKGTPANPAIDIALNATGFDAQNYNLNVDVGGLPKLTFDSGGTFARFTNACSVGFGGTPNTTCAQVDIQSTTKGLLLPRLTKAQRDAISSPVAGLAIYQTDSTPGLRVYNGSTWMRYTETAD